jgi:putative lysine transport system substrate-binding protein/putative lysine transport system permease protein
MKKQSALFAVMPALVLASCGTQAPALDDGILTIGLECGYAPFNWTESTASDTNVAIEDSSFFCEGYDVRVASYLADELGVDLQIRKIEWDGLIPSLTSGNIDAIIAGMTDTPVRRETIGFSAPYFETRSVMIVLKDSDYADALTVTDFEGAEVVGQSGTIQNDLIAAYAESDNWIQGNAYPTYPDALTALLSGGSSIDAILAEAPFAVQMLTQHGDDIEIIEIETDEGALDDDFLVTVSVGVRQSDTALLEGLEEALLALTEATRIDWMNDASTAAAVL